MLNTHFSPWPSFTQEEADAIQNVLLSNRVNYWTGTEGRQFENEYASYCECDYAVALSNGTTALELALRSLGIGQADEVIVTPRTFIASASAIVTVGATPVFADVGPDNGNINASSINNVLTSRTKAIICVHLAGWPCDMDPIMELATKHGLYIIEDCAQAHGAKYKSRPVGSIGHIGTWSFCQDKIITTGGEGGMITTNAHDLWSRIWSYKDHGKSFDAVYRADPLPGFRWLHEGFGSNMRMTEMQAAIGRIQLRRMPQWHSRRLANARRIWNCAQSLPGLRVPALPSDIDHAAYKCYLYVEPDRLKRGWNRDRIIQEIKARDVPCFSGTCSEVYLEKAFDDTNYRPVHSLPTAKMLGDTSLMFLVHPTLTEHEIELTCNILSDVMRSAAT